MRKTLLTICFFFSFFIFTHQISISSTPKKEKEVSIDSVKYFTEAKQVKYWVDHYCKVYNFQNQIIYRLLERETNWRHLTANTDKKYIASQAGDPLKDKNGKIIKGSERSFGPFQIRLNTARVTWNDGSITKKKLRYDIEFNVRTGMKRIAIDHNYFSGIKDRDRRWLCTLSAYNLGRPAFENSHRRPNLYAYEVYYDKWR